ncbi:MAG: OmpA family protein [Humidesulfovibrio sp.]|nr:OmpA family protein [Humidesulfovibrio sp.]
MAENRPIIIKKGKKGHSAAHGGAWKVAYADFMTAMMAFFLLMWLLSMVVPEKRAGVEQYFKEFSLFDKQNALDVRQGGAMIPDQNKPPVPQRDQLTEAAEHGKQPAVQPEQLKSKLQQSVALNLPEVKNQITVDVSEVGVRIEIGYNEADPLFAKGSPELTAKGRAAIQFIGSQLKDLPNKVEVEGHTDSVNYSGGRYTNWELSTDRASAARVALQQGGLPGDHLTRVSGFASTQPLYPDNPADPRNRRISILVRNYVPPKTGEDLTESLGAEKAKPKEPNIAEEVNATIEKMLSVEGRVRAEKAAAAENAKKAEKGGHKP